MAKFHWGESQIKIDLYFRYEHIYELAVGTKEEICNVDPWNKFIACGISI